jgi:transposase
MKPYSQDLRDRAVAAYEAGTGSEAEVAARFGLHKSTLEKWLYRKRDTGSCAALPHASGPARTLQACEDFLRAEVKKQPDVSLAELCERVEAGRGLSASVSMMCRELQILDLPRKKSRSTTASATRRASSSNGRPLPSKSTRSGQG